MCQKIILDELCEERMKGALEARLSCCARYQDSIRDAEEQYEAVMEMLKESVQQEAFDRAISAHNLCGAEYGREAYLQGFQDGVNLLVESMDVPCVLKKRDCVSCLKNKTSCQRQGNLL